MLCVVITTIGTVFASAMHMDEPETGKADIPSWRTALEQVPEKLFAAIHDADKTANYLVERGQLLTLGRAAEPYSREDNREAQQEKAPEWEP